MTADRPEPGPRRTWLVPEVLQISALDCGPAALAALLLGCGLEHSVDELRQACRTGRDGTSIDDLEAVAVELGLAAEQILVPADHLELPEAACAPAILVVLQPGGATHFVTLWRRHGRRVQLMDPGAGRRWPTLASLQGEVYRHRAVVPAAAWRAWAESDGLLLPLGARLRALGVPPAERRALLAAAAGAADWRPLAALDAGARFVHRLVAAGGARRGNEAARLLAALLDRHAEAGAAAVEPALAIPSSCWAARPAPPLPDGEQVLCTGALLVRVRGLAPGAARGTTRSVRRQLPRSTPLALGVSSATTSPLSTLAALGVSSAAAAAARLAETALLVAALQLLPALAARRLRLGALGGLLAAGAALLLLELAAAHAALALGRRRETGLRLRLAARLPHLPDRYLRTRLLSDLAQRAHQVDEVRRGPAIAAAALRAGFEAALAAAGIAWLDPGLAPLALGSAAAALAVPWLLLPQSEERNRRVRAHAAALGGLYLDVLRGLAAVRAHGAAATLRRRHDELLAGWVRAHRSAAAAGARLEVGTQALLSLAMAALVLAHVGRHGLAPQALLIVLWSCQLIAAGQRLAVLLGAELPAARNLLRGIEEPLAAADTAAAGALFAAGAAGPEAVPCPPPPLPGRCRRRGGAAAVPGPRASRRGVELAFVRAYVEVDGRPLLRGLDFTIPAGQHVALLGASGAGKSTLLDTLLGWHRPVAGTLLAGGQVLDAGRLAELRRATAWIAPEVHLWDRSLLANLETAADLAVRRPTPPATSTPGSAAGPPPPDVPPPPPPSPGLAPIDALRAALLFDLVAQLPGGLQTRLGEAGSRLSGGEAQRLRLARALLRPGVRLALLDEPFRGLAADQRRRLLARARRHWRHATLLCVTHAPAEALGFDRVLVLEAGELREDGAPGSLAGDPGTRFHALLAAAAAAGAALQGPGWRRIRLRAGRLHESPTPARPAAPSAAVSSRSSRPPRRPGSPADPHPPPPGRRR